MGWTVLGAFEGWEVEEVEDVVGVGVGVSVGDKVD